MRGQAFAAIKGNYQDSANNGVGWLQILIRKVSTDTTLVPVVTFGNTGNVGIGTQGPQGQLSLGNPQADITAKSWSAAYDQGNIAFYQAREFRLVGITVVCWTFLPVGRDKVDGFAFLRIRLAGVERSVA